MNQAPNSVVMIRPHHFLPNPETADDNTFQSTEAGDHNLTKLAYQQVTDMVEKLTDLGIDVHLFEDTSTLTPDSVFPNNWFSTHSEGKIALYAMYPENRRLERRQDIVNFVAETYQANQIIDFSPNEHQKRFLEGTGAMVLDHDKRIAYAVQSQRCNPALFEEFCQQFNYQPVMFDAVDKSGTPVYHTNVIMTVGTEFVLLADDMIPDVNQRKKVIEAIETSGKTLISLSESQIENFCGNALELNGKGTRLLALSSTAFKNLTSAQKSQLEQSVTLAPFDVSAIETAGGSVRCMLAGIHLPLRNSQQK